MRAAVVVCLLAAALGWTALRLAAASDDDDEPAEPDRYQLRHPERATATIGERGAVSLTIAPRPGYRVSRDGPIVLDLAVIPEEGVILPTRRYRRGDAADPRADAPRFDLSYRAETDGAYRLAVRVRFWLCGVHICWPVDDTREITLEVAAPAPPADAGVGDAAPVASDGGARFD